MWRTITLLCLSMGCALANWHVGQCPKASDRLSFDITKFAGEWFEVSVFNRVFPGTGKCAKGNFTVVNNHREPMSMLFSHTQMDKDGNSVKNEGRLIPTSPGQRIFKYVPEKESVFSTVSHRYHVIGTDYQSWAVIHICDEGIVSYSVSGMLLTREPSDKCLSHFQKKEILGVLKGVKDWRITQFLPNKHDNCGLQEE